MRVISVVLSVSHQKQSVRGVNNMDNISLNPNDLRDLNILSLPEMHTLTLKELETYRRQLYKLWSEAGTIYEYREKIGDEHNVHLLSPPSVEFVDDGDEDEN
tara:strand:- start:254 stop:559 length:306 start_codon:yes stop_codon:yes gene_type:complete